jgi:iron complex outermembrane receptor protein
MASAVLGLAIPARAEIETVTVTAEKTEENILNVGINVTSLSAEDIRTSRIDTPMDLQGQIPNVDIKTNIPGAQQIITIRGVGLDDFSSTNNSSVGVYVDDVFLASFAEMDFNFFDLGRVEVLKGPQGTLYGRNSTAGAINVISAKPALDGVSGRLAAGYGNFQTFQVDGMLNVPAGETFALRFAGRYINQGEGYWFSRVLGRDLGRQDILLGRAEALWQPNSDLSVLFKLEAERSNSEIGVGKFFGTISTTPAGCPDFADPSHCINFHGYTDTTPDVFEGDWNHLAPYKIGRWNATLHIDEDFGWATLTSVTGAINFKRRFYIDADAGPTSDAEFDQNDAVLQYSEELRLAGNANIADWLVGAYYSWDRVHSYTPGTLVDFIGLDTFIESLQKTNSAALFGQAKWHLTDEINLTTGLRYTYEDRSYVGGTDFVVPGLGFHIPLTHQDDKIFSRNLSFRLGLDWKPDEDRLFYVSLSQATKSGGFFNGITTVNEALAPYKPETLTDLEGGMKATLADGALFLDGSLFYYDYHNLQAQTFTNVGAVSLIKLSNIRHASVYGIDLALTWEATDDLSFKGGLGLLHTRLGSFPFAGPGGTFNEPAGNKLPDAPDVSFNAGMRYQHAVFGEHIAALQLETHYGSSVFKEALNTPYLFGGANWTIDGRASLATSDNAWELAFWVKNLFDEKHVVQATDDGIGMGYRVFSAPRTFGITLTRNFE